MLTFPSAAPLPPKLYMREMDPYTVCGDLIRPDAVITTQHDISLISVVTLTGSCVCSNSGQLLLFGYHLHAGASSRITGAMLPGTGLNSNTFTIKIHPHTPLFALPPASLPTLAPLHVLIQRNPAEGEEEKKMAVGRERKDRSLSSHCNNV